MKIVIIKKNLIHVSLKLIAITAFQPIFKFLYKLALKGMNYGAAAYEPNNSGEKVIVQTLARSLKHDPIIFDVGANTGQYAKLVMNCMPNAVLHSFEPSLITYQTLQKKLESYKTVTLHNLGFSDVKAVQTLYYSENKSVKASLNKSENTVLSEEVYITTIDEFCKGHQLNYIDFLKIDVEGYELQVLMGAKEMLAYKNIGYIQFEFGNYQLLTRHFLNDFHKLLHGYTLYRILQNGIYPIDNSSVNEIFFVTNYLAVSNENINTLKW